MSRQAGSLSSSSGAAADSSNTGNSAVTRGYWQKIEPAAGSQVPCQRSLHAGAVWTDCMVIFGGYNGFDRLQDLYSFNFKTSVWTLLSSTNAPSPRDRHIAAVHDNKVYIFGGFDGFTRVNDLHAYNFELNEWRQSE